MIDLGFLHLGTRYSGKSQVLDYYVSVHGFLAVQIAQETVSPRDVKMPFLLVVNSKSRPNSKVLQLSEAVLTSPHTVGGLSTPDVNALPESQMNAISLTPHPSAVLNGNTLLFSSALELLTYVTKNWQLNFVTTDICTRNLVELFVRRPFFILLSVDAPLALRYIRSGEQSLEIFVQDNDRVVFGVDSTASDSNLKDSSGLFNLRELITVHVFNSFNTISGLHGHLQELNLLDPERLRPGWDSYFMTLASLASQRSNCMKRRVGAVLVRENRVVSTGYNGTPRGLRNCNEGGCTTCNGTTLIPDVPVECVCLHAEENALLEAGRERVGTNAVLYCNTCPCLRCTIKIIQTGVKTVVYNLTYKVDEISASLFQEAGVELRRYSPPKGLKL